jgi:hypothetical protein
MNGHPTDATLADLALGELVDDAVDEHVDACDACRALVTRLRRGLPELPDGELPVAAALPVAAMSALADADRPAPTAGELWRARRPDGGPVVLVWIRKTGRAGVDVVPVTLDVELADDATVVVPDAVSPLGVALAVHTGLAATIGADVLLDRLGAVDLASLDGAGPAISSLLDPRNEHRAALADALHELAGGAADDAGWTLADEHSERGALLLDVHRGLGETHRAARVSPRPARASGDERLAGVALVVELDAFVLVTSADRPLAGGDLLEAARAVLHADQLLNAVCVVEPTAPFLAVVVDRRDVVDAIETPSGQLRPPRQSRTPAPVGVALSKFLDATISPFGRLASTIVAGAAVDARGLAVDVVSEAVRAVEASAKTFKVEGKRPGYERVVRHRSSIIRLVEEALAGADVDVASILEDDE